MAQAVIMAGGQGERFWPLTHERFPKYRIRFDGKRSLLQKTYSRLLRAYGAKNVHVVTTRRHASMILEELPEFSKSRLILEPARRNTANAVHLATLLLGRRFGGDEVISFFPADHLIQNEALFRRTLKAAARLAAEKAVLVTVGIRPTFPATGYGYIRTGRSLRGFSGGFCVRRFVEKPDRGKALRYIRQKDFLWNSGIFTWRAGVFLETMRRFAPEIARVLDLKRLGASYRRLPVVSIDRALLEKADNIAVQRTAMDWCDMGSWDMLMEKSAKDRHGNVAWGRFCQGSSRDVFVMGRDHRPIVTFGVKNLLIVQTERGLLVCPRGRSEEAALLAKRNF